MQKSLVSLNFSVFCNYQKVIRKLRSNGRLTYNNNSFYSGDVTIMDHDTNWLARGIYTRDNTHRKLDRVLHPRMIEQVACEDRGYPCQTFDSAATRISSWWFLGTFKVI